MFFFLECLQTRFRDIRGLSRKAFEITDDKAHGAYGGKFHDAQRFQLGRYFELYYFVVRRVYCTWRGVKSSKNNLLLQCSVRHSVQFISFCMLSQTEINWYKTLKSERHFCIFCQTFVAVYLEFFLVYRMIHFPDNTMKDTLIKYKFS